MQASDTIANLKAKILAELHAGCAFKSLMIVSDHRGTKLDDGRTLGDCGVQAGAVLRIQ